MSVSSAGLSAAWVATQSDARTEAVAMAMLKQQNASEQSVVALIEQSMQGAPSGPPAPEGQGTQVDVRA